MARDILSELGGDSVGPDLQANIPESARIYPLITDSGNQRVLNEWLADHESYEAIDPETALSDADFDICIIDDEALRQYKDELKKVKADARPVLLPVLLLLPEKRTDVIETDQGEIADNVFPTRVDEIVSLPIRQTELEWRIQALLRLRSQSISVHRQNESLRLFQQAVESSGHAVYITETDGTIRYVNSTFEEITGFTRDEAIGETPRILHSGEMSDEYYESIWDTILSGDIWKEEIINQRANGDQYAAEQTIAPVADNDEIRAFVAVQTDITERKEREETLQRRTQAIDGAPIGITITDPDLEDNPLIYVNDGFVDLTGYSREETLGKNCRFLQGENTDPDRVARIREAIDAQEPISITLRNYRKDGTEFWNHLEIAPVRNDTGDVVNYVGFQQDVTERKERQQQLAIIDRVLRHNIRNDMNVIRGHAETIHAKTSGEVTTSAEQIIDKSEQFLNMAEKERKITELLVEPPRQERIEVGDLLQKVASAVESEYPGTTITVECPEEVTAQATTGFEQAIRELVTNAIIHNDSSSPEVLITVTSMQETIRIKVADNGPRIPEMDRNILQQEMEQTSLYHGSGLGLWFVKLIIARSSGTITVGENSPRGNIISIELPR